MRALSSVSVGGWTAIAAVIAIALVFLVVRRPALTTAPGGKILAFFAFFLLPVVVTGLGATAHVEHAKSTEFCLSCHVMEPYGRSLHIDDKEHLPAAHFQNNRIPRQEACYTCHTTYTMFGGVRAKLQGLRHIYIYYLGTIPQPIKLREPYNNRECLHCHAGARSFEESDLHKDIRPDLGSGKTSCLECHSSVHDVEHLGKLPMWKEKT
jgi:cytochrome c-type protein NapC